MPDKLKIKFEKLWLKSNPELLLKPEYYFAYPRKFRADYAHIKSSVLIDLQGGVWLKGRSGHSSGTGIIRDCKKLFMAQELGYKMFYLPDAMITAEYLRCIADIIKKG
jgi:hypothetical protein